MRVGGPVARAASRSVHATLRRPRRPRSRPSTDVDTTAPRRSATAARTARPHLDRQDRRQRRAALRAAVARRSRAALARSRAPRRSPWLAVALALLPRDDPGQRLALGAAARRAARPRAVRHAGQLVPRRDVLQQLSAVEHRRRRHPHPRHGAHGRLEDARDDGRARRSRHRPARAWSSSRRSARRSRRAAAKRIGPVGPGVLWALLGRRARRGHPGVL